MTFWDFANFHPIALTLVVFAICDAAVQIFRAIFKWHKSINEEDKNA